MAQTYPLPEPRPLVGRPLDPASEGLFPAGVTPPPERPVTQPSLGGALAPQPLAAADKSPEAVAQRTQGWLGFFDELARNPKAQMLLFQIGTRMMQPIEPQQSTGGHIANALSGGMEYLAAKKQLEDKAAAEAEARALEARKVADLERGTTGTIANQEEMRKQEERRLEQAATTEERLRREGESEAAYKARLAKQVGVVAPTATMQDVEAEAKVRFELGEFPSLAAAKAAVFREKRAAQGAAIKNEAKTAYVTALRQAADAWIDYSEEEKAAWRKDNQGFTTPMAALRAAASGASQTVVHAPGGKKAARRAELDAANPTNLTNPAYIKWRDAQVAAEPDE